MLLKPTNVLKCNLLPSLHTHIGCDVTSVFILSVRQLLKGKHTGHNLNPKFVLATAARIHRSRSSSSFHPPSNLSSITFFYEGPSSYGPPISPSASGYSYQGSFSSTTCNNSSYVLRSTTYPADSFHSSPSKAFS